MTKIGGYMDKIKELLAASAADDYEIEEIKESGWEFYFIRHKLDQNRAKDVTSVKIKVFKKLEEGEFLGSAVGTIKVLIDKLVYQAGLVKNPYYELNGASEAEVELGADSEVGVDIVDNDCAKVSMDIQKTSRDYIETFAAIPETETEFLNSYEIFVSRKEKHFMNFRGIDICMEYPTSMIEVVTNARTDSKNDTADSESGLGHNEIELYRIYNRGTCDREGLTKDVTELLTMGKDRLDAVPTPNLKKAPLILSTQDAAELMDYFFNRVNAGYKYQRLSDWEIGKPIADGVKGDKITLTALPLLPNSSRNFTHDEEGAVIKERVLIRDNVKKN